MPFGSSWQRRRQPHRPLSPVSYRLLADLYFVYWPLLLAALLALHDIALVGVLVFTIVWLRRNLSLLMVNAIEVLAGCTAPPEPSPASGQASRDDKTFEHAVVFQDSGQLEKKRKDCTRNYCANSRIILGALCRFGNHSTAVGKDSKKPNACSAAR